jgi:hypothetical protein
VLLHHPSAIPLTHHPASTINWKPILLGGATLLLPGGWPMADAPHDPCTALAIVASAIQRPQIVHCAAKDVHDWTARRGGQMPPNPCLPNKAITTTVSRT